MSTLTSGENVTNERLLAETPLRIFTMNYSTAAGQIRPGQLDCPIFDGDTPFEVDNRTYYVTSLEHGGNIHRYRSYRTGTWLLGLSGVVLALRGIATGE